jgi:hypothetical protein
VYDNFITADTASTDECTWGISFITLDTPNIEELICYLISTVTVDTVLVNVGRSSGINFFKVGTAFADMDFLQILRLLTLDTVMTITLYIFKPDTVVRNGWA